MSRRQSDSPQPWYELADVPPRVYQLVQLSRRGVLGLQDGSATENQRLFSDVDESAWRVWRIEHDRETQSIYRRVRFLLDTAIAKIEDEKYREAALWLFGMKGSAKMASGERRREAASIFFVNFSTWRKSPRYEERLIRWIDETISDLSNPPGQPLRHGDDDVQPVGPIEHYVHRQKFERLFAIALQLSNHPAYEKARLVMFVGESGVGKTMLAQQLVAARGTLDRRLVLNAATEDSLLLDARNALGVEAESLSDTAVKLRLRKLLENPQAAPSYVLMDGVEDWNLVEQVVPTRPVSFVVMTGRRELAKRWCAYVEVGPMTEGEAEEMVKARLPRLSSKEVAALVVLRDRPLAIEQACAFLKRCSNAEASSFFIALRKNVIQALDLAAGSLGEQALTSVYADIIASLRAQPETMPAVRMLEFIAAAGELRVSSQVEDVFRASYGNDDVGRLAWRSARDVLEHHRLVDVTWRSMEKALDEWCEIRVHPLTLAVLRSLFTDRSNVL